jgi:hypothetical protein
MYTYTYHISYIIYVLYILYYVELSRELPVDQVHGQRAEAAGGAARESSVNRGGDLPAVGLRHRRTGPAQYII